MHRRYDLQGGVWRPALRAAATNGDGSAAARGGRNVLKDNDLARPLRLARASALEAIGAQVDADVSFLAAHGLMDYSLLVGVCHPRLEQPHTPTSPGGGGMLSPGPSPGRRRCRRRRGDRGAARRALWDGAAPPAPWADRADGGAEGAVAAADGTEEAALVYFGLIDVLTKWGARKAAEHVAKAAGAPARRNEISCVPPRQYGARFVRKMAGVARRAGRRRARRVGARHAGARHAGDAEAARCRFGRLQPRRRRVTSRG